MGIGEALEIERDLIRKGSRGKHDVDLFVPSSRITWANFPDISSRRRRVFGRNVSWGDEQADEKPGDQAAHVRGHAYLGRGKIESRLNDNNHDHVRQPLPGRRQVTMKKEERSPAADDSHDGPGRADENGRSNETEPRQHHDAGGRSNSSDEIADAKTERADCSFQRHTQNIEGEEIEKEMHRPGMQEERGEQAPVLAENKNRNGLKRTELMEGEIIPAAVKKFGARKRTGSGQ